MPAVRFVAIADWMKLVKIRLAIQFRGLAPGANGSTA